MLSTLLAKLLPAGTVSLRTVSASAGAVVLKVEHLRASPDFSAPPSAVSSRRDLGTIKAEIRMRFELGLVALSLCLVGATACETQHGASSFASSDTMRAQPVAFGDVVSVRQVDIRPGQTHLGMATGAALGALAGSQLGRNASANAAGGIGGAVVGSQAGSAIQGSQVSRGIEVSVTMDDGQTVAIIQPGDPRDFRVGDRVRIVGTSDNARVAH